RPRAVSGNGLVAPWRHRFIWLWPKSFPPGNYALGVLAWYGLGRFFLEPLREAPDLIAGRVRINQCVAAALGLGAGGALLARAFAWGGASADSGRGRTFQPV